MRVVTIHAPKDLRIEEGADPAALGPRDVLVRVGAGGICGSDLHYYHHGGFGTVRLREPMILGHEVAGTVSSVGAEVRHVKQGDRVAVNPSLPCGNCRYCNEGHPNHCLDMRFYGSAMRFPHVQGAFRDALVCDASQAVPVAAGVSLATAAFAEPLAVCLHAVRQAAGGEGGAAIPNLTGKNVLVTGAGPIGCLTVLAARHAGAANIVITDIAPATLRTAARIGADRCIDTRADPDAMQGYAVDKGTFDVAFEASGSAAALATALQVVRPKGTIVQVGMGAGEAAVALNMLVAKEIGLRGTFRFHEEFAQAVDVLGRGAIDVAPLLTETLPLAQARRAFELASDRSQAMKVQLAFD